MADGERGSILYYDKDSIIGRCGKATISVGDIPETKVKAIETTERYDKDGKLVEKIVREIEKDDEPAKGVTCGKLSEEYAAQAYWCGASASTAATTALPSESHG